jgi:Ca2+-binding RTX toxin-like protein
MRRRVMLLPVAMVGALIVTSGVALAVTLNPVNCADDPAQECYGTPKPDGIIGTNNTDLIYGLDGDDIINADSLGSESDLVKGGRGDDTITDNVFSNDGDSDFIYGNRGNDLIDVMENSAWVDTVYCGTGKDTVYADPQDHLFGCERVNP